MIPTLIVCLIAGLLMYSLVAIAFLGAQKERDQDQEQSHAPTAGTRVE